MGVYARFADLLEYPDSALGPRLASLGEEMREDDAVARAALARFREEADRLGLPSMQELYTSAFDLDAACSLYGGHHLFGETARRGVFMARLAEEYRRAGFHWREHELPDHLAVMLRYVDGTESSEPAVRDELVTEVIVPAARRVLEALENRTHPYALVVGALLAQLEGAGGAGRSGAEALT